MCAEFRDSASHFYSRKRSYENLDRFIPNRSSMNMDFANYMMTGGWKTNKDNKTPISKSSEAYRQRLAEFFDIPKRILCFKYKPPTPVEAIPKEFSSAHYQATPNKRQRHIPQTPEKILDAPGIVDDYCLNLLDWGSRNVLSIALGHAVYLWNNGSTSELLTSDNEDVLVTSVKWAPDGRRIAVALNNSDVQLWDTTTNQLLVKNMRGSGQSQVGALDWNNHMLTTGGMDGLIHNIDVRVGRMRARVVQTYRGHSHQVCGLKWSTTGRQLASGGNDNLLYIWDISKAASNSSKQWLHRFESHTAAVRGVAWSPFKSNLLASGGGDGCNCIKLWDTHTGACENSIDTGSSVCALLWNKNGRELLSSHGFTKNQLTLWKYPSMVKMAELTGHTSPVIFMGQSPDGCTVASAAGDETLRFWNVFETPEVAKQIPFLHINRIR